MHEQESRKHWLVRVTFTLNPAFDHLDDCCNSKLSSEETELLVNVFCPVEEVVLLLALALDDILLWKDVHSLETHQVPQEQVEDRRHYHGIEGYDLNEEPLVEIRGYLVTESMRIEVLSLRVVYHCLVDKERHSLKKVGC